MKLENEVSMIFFLQVHQYTVYFILSFFFINRPFQYHFIKENYKKYCEIFQISSNSNTLNIESCHNLYNL